MRPTRVPRRAILAALASLGLDPGLARATDPTAPVSSSRTLAAGTRFATPVHERQGPVKGPTVLVVAGIHGNELAPPEAARGLLEEPLLGGRMVVVPLVNRPAADRKSRFTPSAQFADLNRNFPSGGRPARGELAPVLFDFVTTLAPDWVLDLHEGWGFSASSKSMGSSIVRARDPRTDTATRHMSDTLLDVVNATITDPKRKFTRIEPGPAGSFARAVVETLGTPALVVETTWVQPLELRVAQQRRLVRAALRTLGMLSPG